MTRLSNSQFERVYELAMGQRILPSQHLAIRKLRKALFKAERRLRPDAEVVFKGWVSIWSAPVNENVLLYCEGEQPVIGKLITNEHFYGKAELKEMGLSPKGLMWFSEAFSQPLPCWFKPTQWTPLPATEYLSELCPDCGLSGGHSTGCDSAD